jgi:hypothetical protein
MLATKQTAKTRARNQARRPSAGCAPAGKLPGRARKADAHDSLISHQKQQNFQMTLGLYIDMTEQVVRACDWGKGKEEKGKLFPFFIVTPDSREDLLYFILVPLTAKLVDCVQNGPYKGSRLGQGMNLNGLANLCRLVFSLRRLLLDRARHSKLSVSTKSRKRSFGLLPNHHPFSISSVSLTLAPFLIHW